MSDEMIRLSEPWLGEEEKRALAAVVDSGWITSGPRVAEFERAFALVHGHQDAVAVSSCTAGLHLALAGLGIGPGDEVLVPAMTFVATVNAVLYAGATPVFVDIESLTTPHLSLADAAGKVTGRTRAVIVMHYGGYPVDLEGWSRFARDRGLSLIEDAAHSPAAEGVGRSSRVTVFSFFGNKNLTTAEGGMILADGEDLLSGIRLLRSHAMTTTTLDRERGHAYQYDVTALGFNYRLDELRAAVGLAQLARLPEWNARRRRLTALYREAIAARLPELQIAFEESSTTAAHLLAAVLPEEVDRAELMRRLRERGIQTSIHYPAAHQFSYHRSRFPEISLPLTEAFARRELSLPLHPALNAGHVERVVDGLAACWEQARATARPR